MTDTSIKLRFPVLGNNVFYYIFDHQINQSHFMKKILYYYYFQHVFLLIPKLHVFLGLQT